MWPSEFSRYDILEAHYAFCCDYYSGMNDPLYARLCRISKRLKPGPMWRGYESLGAAAQYIYDCLVAKLEEEEARPC